MRLASSQGAKNPAEGMAASGGVRRQAYSVALREARESVAAVDLAARWGYAAADDEVLDRLDKIVATLMRLVMPRKR